MPLLHPQATPSSNTHQPIRASMQINPTKMATATESRREAWVSLKMEEAKLSTCPCWPRPPLNATKFQL